MAFTIAQISDFHLTTTKLVQDRLDSVAKLDAGIERLLALDPLPDVVIISGDRHWSELSASGEDLPYPIHELTSSSLNQVHPRGTRRRRRSPLEGCVRVWSWAYRQWRTSTVTAPRT